MNPPFLPALLAGVLLISWSTSACAVFSETEEVSVQLSDSGVTVDGAAASTDPSAAVYTGAELIYYQDGTDSSYGEGTPAEMHSSSEAAAHTVVTITQPGTYRLSGSLSKGQLAVDLGEGAENDPNAVVTLILDGVEITCTAAPAVIFYRVYECGSTDLETASGTVDTSGAGANVVIAAGSENTITGSHVARIYKEGTTKKLHKYDGAFYSKMSMNLTGEDDTTSILNIIADNEGLDSELHLTINGGVISIQSQDDGINTNEDGVSVTAINGGMLTINAGQGSEGDGIDSNGYLTINGGTIWTMSHSSSPDGGIDADAAIAIHGGTLFAFGTRNDAVDNSSSQPYLELSFAATLPSGSAVSIEDGSGNEIMRAVTQKTCQSLTYSSGALKEGEVYHVFVDGVQQQYTGNRSGMMGRPGGHPMPPDGFQPGQGGRPDGTPAHGQPDGTNPPDGMAPPDGMTPPDGARPEPPEGVPGAGGEADGEGSVDFTITSSVHSFSGISDSDKAGKTRVTFTVNGGKGISSVPSGGAVSLSDIRASIDGVPESEIQITITDIPSENYAETCLLSDGAGALSELLPTDDGVYQLTVAVSSSSQDYTGVSQWQFTIGGLPFRDVRQDSPAYEAVKFVYEAGLMQGTSETAFSPSDTVSRAQAITVLARLADAQAAEQTAFSDVPSGLWYSGYVGWASENGIVQGDGSGHFLPDLPVTGAHMELMMTRYAQTAHLDYTPSNTSEQPLTRAELAQMLMRLEQS